VALGDGDLVDGDAPQVLELGLGEAPRQVALLDVLDQVPADAQVGGTSRMVILRESSRTYLSNLLV
jgi:hypothetical protein